MINTIALLNQKGGVGKTTTAVNLAAALEEMGYPSLVVDLDAQMNATSWLFGRRLEDQEASIFDSLETVGSEEEKEFRLSELIENGSLDLIPSSRLMSPSQFDPAVSRDGAYPHQLRVRIEELADEADRDSLRSYRFCILDCPPSLSRVVVVALTASNGIVVPVAADKFSLEGLSQLRTTVEKVREYNNEELDVLGFLPNNLDRRSGLVKDVENQFRDRFGDLMFETSIPWRSKINDATAHGEHVLSFAPNSEAASFYRSLADEVINRA